MTVKYDFNFGQIYFSHCCRSFISFFLTSLGFINLFRRLIFQTGQDLCIYFSERKRKRYPTRFLQFKFVSTFGYGCLEMCTSLAWIPTRIFLTILRHVVPRCPFIYAAYIHVHPKNCLYHFCGKTVLRIFSFYNKTKKTMHYGTNLRYVLLALLSDLILIYSKKMPKCFFFLPTYFPVSHLKHWKNSWFMLYRWTRNLQAVYLETFPHRRDKSL